MLQYDYEQSVGYWVFATAHEFSLKMNEELAEHGITFRQMQLLAWISFAGQMSQTELAERMLIEAPTLVGVLDRMERDGWIRRVADPGDRRKKLICVTEQVEPVWAKMVECALRVRAQARQGVSDEQLELVRKTLGIIRRNLAGDAALDRLTTPQPIPPTSSDDSSAATR